MDEACCPLSLVRHSLIRTPREPKDVSDEDYKAFYSALTKDETAPMFWSHFKVGLLVDLRLPTR